MGSVQCLAQQPAEVFRFSKFDQPPERSIGVRGRRVDEKSGLIRALINICIDPLSDACGIVSALQASSRISI